MIQTHTGADANHLMGMFKGGCAFLVTEARPPEELAKLNRRGILLIATDSANIVPHIWFGNDPAHPNWTNPSIIKISNEARSFANSYQFAGERSEALKWMGVDCLFHVGSSHPLYREYDLDAYIEHALKHMPEHDNVVGLYSYSSSS